MPRSALLLDKFETTVQEHVLQVWTLLQQVMYCFAERALRKRAD
jgi:hypothetical protein